MESSDQGAQPTPALYPTGPSSTLVQINKPAYTTMEKDPPRMTTEQRERFDNLTRLQQRILINLLNGMDAAAAYKEAGGKSKPEHVKACACQILRNPQLSSLFNDLKAAQAERALVTTEDLVKSLRELAGLNVPVDSGDLNHQTQIQAIKLLIGYTGGFDNNIQKTELSGYIERSESDFYDDE